MNSSTKAIIGNIVLMVLNIIIGLITGSSSLLSEGINNISDVVASTIGAIAIRIGKSKPTKEYPYGKGNVEPLTGLFFGLVLIVLGFSVLWDSAIKLWNIQHLEKIGILAGSMALIGVFINLYIMKALLSEAEKTNSQVLESMGKEKKLDIFASIGIILAVIGSEFGYPILDPLLALVIAGLIFKTGWELIHDNYDSLLGKVPNNLEKRIKDVVLYINEVQNVSSIKIQPSGPYYYVTLDISLSESMHIDNAYKICKEVERIVINNIQFIKDVSVSTIPEGD